MRVVNGIGTANREVNKGKSRRSLIKAIADDPP
jgi:hypothetical protein